MLENFLSQNEFLVRQFGNDEIRFVEMRKDFADLEKKSVQYFLLERGTSLKAQVDENKAKINFLSQELHGIYILFKMEIESSSWLGPFEPIHSSLAEQIKYDSVIYEIDVGFHQFESHSHKLLLTRTSVFLSEIPIKGQQKHSTSILHTAKIDFELIFEIEYEEHDKPQSKKIGLNLFRNEKNIAKLYCANEFALNVMRGHLGRFLNQRGFHSQFKPIKKLGKGNFASVYQVIRVEDGKKFAVKAFSKANTFSAENGKESLINELSVMRELSHKSKNLLCLDSVYESNNSIYIVLELLEGKNLFEVIKERNCAFNLEETKAILKGLLNGLKSMDECGIMHRDLKPENIMFRSSNLTTPDTYDPVIVDFGLAAQCDATPYLFFRCGTPGFVAPEIIKVAQNERYSNACDMFSIGCIFHLLITNNPIFPGSKYDEVYKKNKLLDFHLKEDLMNKVSPFAFDMLERMLEASPETRLTPTEAINNCFFIESKSDNDMKREDDLMTNYPTSPHAYLGNLQLKI